ncbi:MAG: ImmA/IrrE family metallo-endopeptidase [Oscillospiraceae bacterium]|nr:ImmA/IrrE family metallo-endopeptidase [Oscillospiraceae bacterium]
MTYKGKTIVLLDEDIPQKLKRLFRGITIVCADEYIIVIDRAAAPIVQRFILGHELAHIYMNHFDRKHNHVDGLLRDKECERQANKQAWYYYRLYRDRKEVK